MWGSGHGRWDVFPLGYFVQCVQTLIGLYVWLGSAGAQDVKRRSRLVQSMQHYLTFDNYLVFFLPPPSLLSPQQGVFGAQRSNPAMSIIGAEDEDFENDLSDVSSRRAKWDLVASFVVAQLKLVFTRSLLLSGRGGPVHLLQQHRALEGKADPPAGLHATCHSAVRPCSPGENSQQLPCSVFMKRVCV